MDSFSWECSGSQNGCGPNHDAVSANPNPNTANVFELIRDNFLEYGISNLPPTSNVQNPVIHRVDFFKKMERDSGEENYFSEALKYINEVLMEDEPEDKACTIEESTLDAAEKSLSELLKYRSPLSPNQPLPLEGASSDSNTSTILSCCNCSSCSSVNGNDSAGCSATTDLHEYNSSHVHTASGLVMSPINVPLESQICWPFDKGKNNRLTHPREKEKVLKVNPKTEQSVGEPENGLPRGRKSLQREESDEGRSNKHLASYAEESVLHEVFDKILSLYCKNDECELKTSYGASPHGASGVLRQNEQAIGFTRELTYPKRGVCKKRKAIDTRSLLIKCVQFVAGNDHGSASKLLRQLKSCSSPSGDGSQRLAYYFTNSLEARLIGVGSQEHKALAARSISGPAVLKAYKMYLSTFPFQEASIFFANQVIEKISENSSSLHIIHFGVLYGFQWPPLIQSLSKRPGGPPKLRITGIDLVEAGLRPDSRIKATGHHLANYCEKFKVPFEFNGIAQKWDTITVEDLKIEKDEVLVVNCLYLLMYQLDDTIMEHSPRDAVLNLIKRTNPAIFIHAIVNAGYNSPFFVSRFREALFYFSTLFDMLDAYLPPHNQERLVFERDVLGKKILNAVACEGVERVERPETYKQWQSRTLRAGFGQLPLNQEIVKGVRGKMKSCYSRDFFVDEASEWMLCGWKGRVLIALSCWEPA